MKTLRAVIVDDERLARKQLAKLLGDQPGVQLVGEARNLAAAIELAASEAPDVIFLDISMPPDSGFDLLPHLQAGVRVVFVTAHDEHAIRAFDENAVDYLLKPVKPERLLRTLERLRLAATVAVEENVPQVDLGKGFTIPLHEITAVVADGNYSWVYLSGGGNFHVRRPIREWVVELAGGGFIQPGRSLLLLTSAVHRLESPTRNEYYLYLNGSAVPLKLGRHTGARVRELIGL